MFKTTIMNTPMNTRAAESFFEQNGPHIIQDGFPIFDNSFISTLRALVAPRMPQDRRLDLVFLTTNTPASVILRCDSEKTIIGNLFGRNDYLDVIADSIVVTNIVTGHNSNQEWMSFLRESFTKAYPSWQMLDKVTLFFQKQFDVLCFVNAETRSVVLFAEAIDISRFHYLQCGTFAFLPWYFNPDDGASEQEMELIYSLREKTPQKYEACLAAIAEKYDFRKAFLKDKLAGFETRYESIQCEQVRGEIQRYINDIDQRSRAIADLLVRKRECEIKLLGLETKIAQSSGESEILDYFICNDRIILEDVNNTGITFGVRDYIAYFDEDMAKSVIDNDASYVYKPNGRSYDNIIPAQDMKALMTALFVEQTLRIKVCAAYILRFERGADAIERYSYGSDYKNCTPNPHIDKYRCMGNYGRQIIELIKNNNYIGALEQCVASCKSLNFADSTVMIEFMKRIYGVSGDKVNMNCIELPDGRVVNPREAIEYLKQEGQANV